MALVHIDPQPEDPSSCAFTHRAIKLPVDSLSRCTYSNIEQPTQTHTYIDEALRGAAEPLTLRGLLCLSYALRK